MFPRLVGRMHLKETYSLHSEHESTDKVVHALRFFFVGVFFLFSLWVKRAKRLFEGSSFPVIVFLVWALSGYFRQEMWLRAINKSEFQHCLESRTQEMKAYKNTEIMVNWHCAAQQNDKTTKCPCCLSHLRDLAQFIWHGCLKQADIIQYSQHIIGWPHKLMIKSFLRLKHGLKFMSRKMFLHVLLQVLRPYYCLSLLQGMSPH